MRSVLLVVIAKLRKLKTILKFLLVLACVMRNAFAHGAFQFCEIVL